MFISPRLVFWSLLSVMLLAGSTLGEEATEVAPSQQRRELWDFFSFVSLLAQLGPKPCTRPDGTPDWGPEQGPRWKHCSRQASSTSYETTDETETTSENMEYAVSSSESSAGEASTSNITSSGAAQGFQLWMLVIAGTVASALVAMRLGQQKGPVAGRKHDMSGSVTRRVGAVGAFAAGLFPSNRAKEVEMNASRPEYKLDMSDDGNHPSTSAMV